MRRLLLCGACGFLYPTQRSPEPAHHYPLHAIKTIAASAMDTDAEGQNDPNSAGLVLYPHFQQAVVPGWLDKHLRWRHRATPALDTMVLLSPPPRLGTQPALCQACSAPRPLDRPWIRRSPRWETDCGKPCSPGWNQGSVILQILSFGMDLFCIRAVECCAVLCCAVLCCALFCLLSLHAIRTAIPAWFSRLLDENY